MSGDVASVTPSIGGQSFNDALMAVTRHSSRILIPASSFESPCLAQILNALLTKSPLVFAMIRFLIVNCST